MPRVATARGHKAHGSHHAHAKAKAHDKDVKDVGGAMQHSQPQESHLGEMDDEDLPKGAVHEDDDFEMERYAFDWVASKKSELANPSAFETITPKQIIEEYGVPRYIIHKHISGEIEEAAACSSCVFILMVVICYSCMVINHFDLATLRAVEDSIQILLEDKADFFDGSTDFTDTREYADVWSFLGVGVVGLIFPGNTDVERSDHFGDFYPDLTEYMNNTKGMIGQYNRVVGGVRLRQERQPIAACGVGGGIEEVIGKAFPHDCRGNRDRWWEEEPELVDRSFLPDEDLTVWLWAHEPIDSVMQKIGVMETDMWMNFGTSKVEIGIPIYNDEFGVHSYTTMIFTFSPGGQVFAQVSSQSCYYSLYLSKLSFVFDGIYFVFLMNIIFGEFSQIFQAMKDHGGCKGLVSYYVDPSNLFDWATVFTGLGLIAFWVQTIALTTKVNVAAESIGLLKLKGDSGDVKEVIDYMTYLEGTVWLVGIIQRYVAIFPLILVFRLFMAFHGQPRLALVTKTMIQASSDLVHFGILMMATFICFVISGHIFFGASVVEYSSLFRSVMSCLRLLLGDIDFGDAADSDRAVVGVFVFLFCSFCTILLMNILISIILDAYAKVKEVTGNAETLGQETKQLIYRTRDQFKGKFCKHEVVIKALELKAGQIAQTKKKRANEQELVRSENDDDDEAAYGEKQKKESKQDVEESFQTSPSRKDGDPDSPDSPDSPPTHSRHSAATRVSFDDTAEVQLVDTEGDRDANDVTCMPSDATSVAMHRRGNESQITTMTDDAPPPAGSFRSQGSFTLTDKRGSVCLFEKKEKGNSQLEKVTIGLGSYTAREVHEHQSWNTKLLKEQDLIDLIATLDPPKFGKPKVLTEDQAHEMMVEAVKEHYESHKHNADNSTLMKLAAKVNKRTMAVGHFGDYGDNKEVSVKKNRKEGKTYRELTDVVREVVTFINDIQADRIKGQHKLAILRDDVQALRSLVTVSDEELLDRQLGTGKESERVKRLFEPPSSELYAPNGDRMPQDENPPPPGVTESTRTDDYIRLLQAHGLLSLDHVEPPNQSKNSLDADDSTLLGPMVLGEAESSRRSMNTDDSGLSVPPVPVNGSRRSKDSRDSGYSSMSGTDMSGTDVEDIENGVLSPGEGTTDDEANPAAKPTARNGGYEVPTDDSDMDNADMQAGDDENEELMDI